MSLSDSHRPDPATDSPVRLPDTLAGAALIAAETKNLSDQPGVYRMLGAGGEVLYVGKARSLKKRVSQYAKDRLPSPRIALMVSLTRSMVFVTTATETEALLLEINLIKALKPKFNILLRDDKSFPEILIRNDHPAPQIRKHRGAHVTPGEYFGPFASTWAVNRALDSLQKAFLLRSCSDNVYEQRTRPCLLYQIKRCSGPCVGLIDPHNYEALVSQARQFLRGKSRQILEKLSCDMQMASDRLDFEAAAVLRDRIRALSSLTAEQIVNPDSVEEADVFAVYQQGDQACIQVFFFRSGQNWGNRAYFIKVGIENTESEILDSFLGQFYDDKPVPELILLSHDLPNKILLSEIFRQKSDQKAGRKGSLILPQRGEKAALVAHALANAKEALGRKMAETASHKKLLEDLATCLELKKVPERLEVYDNSHIMGQNAVGAMIVVGTEGFLKNQYRKFHIKNTEITPGDDYAMMREVLSRRLNRLQKSETSHFDSQWPDLLIIDGGQGQLGVALDCLSELGFGDEISVVAIAKGPDRHAGLERLFQKDRAVLSLDPKAPVLHFLQRLRDEAHRFAISTHRAKRSADFLKNPLDEIEGIGAGRKRALLHAFGSARAVKEASPADLKKIPGISEALALRIAAHFQK